MIALKDFDDSRVEEYSTENLRMFVNEIEMRKSIIREKCASEMAKYLKDERFDAYSFMGRRKLRKIAKKYDDALAGADVYMKAIKKELSHREVLEEEAKYSGRGIVKPKQMSQDEFLQKEQDKTMALRSKIE